MLWFVIEDWDNLAQKWCYASSSGQRDKAVAHAQWLEYTQGVPVRIIKVGAHW